jgi:hypothetical protein
MDSRRIAKIRVEPIKQEKSAATDPTTKGSEADKD